MVVWIDEIVFIKPNGTQMTQIRQTRTDLGFLIQIFLPQSHGYRPNTDAHAAVRKGEAYLEKGYHWVLDADIEGFFDHVDHQIMMDLVCEKIADGRVLSLIEMFLKSGIMNEGVFEESLEGTPQSGNLIPLLSNIYLNHFDRRMGDYGLAPSPA